MTVSLNESIREKVKRWGAFLISPVVWTIYFLVVYAFDEIVCGLDVLRSPVWGQVSGAVGLMFLMTIVTLAVTGVGVYLGRQLWRDSRESEHISAERDRFIGLSSMLLSGLFAILTVGMAAVIVVLNPC